MQWNLHVVGEALETDLEDVLAKFVSELEAIGHKLTSATLTTDTGQRALPTTPVDLDSSPATSDDDKTTVDDSPKTDTPPAL